MATLQMPLRARVVGVRRKRLLAAMLLLTAAPVFAANENVTARIALAPLGYPRRLPNREVSGSAMYTLNYIDNRHLLFTFTMHELLRRIPNDPLTDEDRNVTAVVLELPSGKVIARTTWRLHDYSQYLWDIGDGRFMVRKRNVLTTIAPLANAADPFAEQPLIKLDEDQAIANIQLTFDRGVMVLEVSSTAKPPVEAGQKPNLKPQVPPVSIQFIRLLSANNPAEPVRLRLDMTTERRAPTEFSLTSTGFLQVTKEKSYRWGFNFQQYDGKAKRLSDLESSCAPFPVFVSPSEFISFGCRGSEYKASLTGFNLKGDLAWQMPFGESQSFSTLSTAPQAGRFAISRGLSAASFLSPSMPSQIAQQEVRVLQNFDGRELLRVNCSPIQAVGQNFALSPDGMSFVAMQDAIVVYALPPLTEADQKEVAASKAMAPAVLEEAKVDLSRVPDIPLPPPPEPVATSDGLMAAGADVPEVPLPPAQTVGPPQPDSAEQRSPLVQHRPTIFVPQ